MNQTEGTTTLCLVFVCKPPDTAPLRSTPSPQERGEPLLCVPPPRAPWSCLRGLLQHRVRLPHPPATALSPRFRIYSPSRSTEFHGGEPEAQRVRDVTQARRWQVAPQSPRCALSITASYRPPRGPGLPSLRIIHSKTVLRGALRPCCPLAESLKSSEGSELGFWPAER